ncbi:uncharacterized protein [Triticum aestivum]|uniref:uncharacterized protein isoform X2 n=1 Tax=Triticum aestivum TaxID=4565 RepID=UPI0008434BB0|nr:uncharacterized protein LOC123085902 isoform X2 [Triticum aestivum]
MDVLSKRFALFGFIAGWSIATSAETGPTFQLALVLVSCIYFLNDKMKEPWQGVCYRAWTLCEWLDSRFAAWIDCFKRNLLHFYYDSDFRSKLKQFGLQQVQASLLCLFQGPELNLQVIRFCQC